MNNGGTHYFAWVTSGGLSYQYAIPTTTGATVQQYPNGCATCDYDSTVNKISVLEYIIHQVDGQQCMLLPNFHH